VRNLSAHSDPALFSFFFFSIVVVVVVFFFFALSMALTASKCARNLRVSSSVAHVVILGCWMCCIIIVRVLQSSPLFVPKKSMAACRDTTTDGERTQMLLLCVEMDV
tara:strand:+ start:247 stop:567 length:321 start_codon:yes stop_codon:yes gene_type:complete